MNFLKKIYKQNADQYNYILIKLTDTFPFFEEKVFVTDGVERREKNYHIADGMFSTYINYEMPRNQISAEISGPISFEITGDFECPVWVMNAGTKELTIRIRFQTDALWTLGPGAYAPLYPRDDVKVADEFFEEDRLSKEDPSSFLTQEEIIKLLKAFEEPSC